MRPITEIIVHCSATRPSMHVTLEDIDRWHRNRGFRSIGYHFVVFPDGHIENGRPIEEQGAHCKGHNRDSIGICYIGGIDDETGKPADTRTTQQKRALTNLLRRLIRQFPAATIHSHRDFANKACPSFDATREYQHLTT